MITITMSSDQHIALTNAIALGALAERHATLRSLLSHNQGHASIANGIEREIDDLKYAAAAVLAARHTNAR